MLSIHRFRQPLVPQRKAGHEAHASEDRDEHGNQKLWLASELGVAERTRFLGLRSDLSAVLQDADIFVHPAVWQEAFGLAIAEAMATGCPVVGSNVGAVPELVVDGVTGLLVPPGDSHAIAGALEQLAMDPELRNRLGQAARTRAEQIFDLEKCVEQHLEWCLSAQRDSDHRSRLL